MSSNFIKNRCLRQLLFALCKYLVLIRVLWIIMMSFKIILSNPKSCGCSKEEIDKNYSISLMNELSTSASDEYNRLACSSDAIILRYLGDFGTSTAWRGGGGAESSPLDIFFVL